MKDLYDAVKYFIRKFIFTVTFLTLKEFLFLIFLVCLKSFKNENEYNYRCELQVGAVGGVLRQIPPTVVAPIILASAATSNLLGGVRSQLVPDARREATLKWRSQDN